MKEKLVDLCPTICTIVCMILLALVMTSIIRDSAENPRPTKSLGDECATTGLFRYPSMERMQFYV